MCGAGCCAVSAADAMRMRAGRSPREACLDALKRIAETTREKRLLDAQGRELRSGMTANIEVNGERKPKVLTVPQATGASCASLQRQFDQSIASHANAPTAVVTIAMSLVVPK